MKRPLLRLAIFVGAMLFFAALAWLGGFNFDERHPVVAFGVAMATALAAWLAANPFID